MTLAPLLVVFAALARAQTKPVDVPIDLWGGVREQAAPEGLITFGATAALFSFARPQDTTVKTAVLSGSRPPVSDDLVHAATTLGNAAVLFPVMGAVYGLGYAAHSGPAQEAGAMGVEALTLAGVETEILKYAARRRRPDGSDLYSFPSGHAAESFSVATTLASQFGWKAGVPAYLAAGFIGYSRLQLNKHWLSDVVAGAGLGVWCGRAVWRVHHKDGRVAFVPWLGPGEAGALVSASF